MVGRGSEIVHEVSYYRKVVEDRKSRRNLLQEQISSKQQQKIALQLQADDLSQARLILSEVAKLTQQNIKNYIESLVTMAIQSVFERPFKFIANFEIKRNKMECQLLVQDGDNDPFVPAQEMGGGLLDIISFALRVVLWSLQQPRSRNVLFLDEPFKFISANMVDKAGQILREISEKLNLQLIIITHNKDLAEIANKTFIVSHDGIQSCVEELQHCYTKEITKKLLRRIKS